MGIFNDKEFGHELAISNIKYTLSQPIPGVVMSQQKEIEKLKEKVEALSEQITELTALVNSMDKRRLCGKIKKRSSRRILYRDTKPT